MQSDCASVVLFAFAVCWALKKGKITKKSDTATIIEPTPIINVPGWLEGQGIEPHNSSVVLFKRVSSDFKTQEGTANETTWTPGTTVDHPAWSPAQNECGAGKFHACSRPYFCDEFRANIGDKYIAVKIAVDDLHGWFEESKYPHKIAFRKGIVLYECDKFGREKKAE